MLNTHSLSDRFTAGRQIDPADMAELKARGFVHVVNNRPDGEVPPALQDATMRAAAEAAGLGYSAIPIGARGIGPDDISAMRTILASAGGPIFGWCLSGTRSTYLWAFAQAAEGADIDALIRQAADAGYDLRGVRPALASLAGNQ